ncbi:MAG: ACT domain-containing protein [Clostridia bacterium]|nr:ACT domain-containing protein [Clostridia bacterium]
MSITQLSVFVENNPGALSRITRLLADSKIDIRAMSLAESHNFGVLRLIVNDHVAAGKVLEANNIVFHFTEVVAASFPDEPGGLSRALELLAEEGIDIAYMYAFIAVSGHSAAVVLRVHGNVREAAAKKLSDGGIKVLTKDDIKVM